LSSPGYAGINALIKTGISVCPKRFSGIGTKKLSKTRACSLFSTTASNVIDRICIIQGKYSFCLYHCDIRKKRLKVKLIPIFLIVYLVCWALSYTIVNQDFSIELMVDYFVMAWTFDSFVRPFYTWILSLLIFLPIVAIYWFISLRKGGDEKYISISIKKNESSE
jgi:hypothetical protein